MLHEKGWRLQNLGRTFWCHECVVGFLTKDTRLTMKKHCWEGHDLNSQLHYHKQDNPYFEISLCNLWLPLWGDHWHMLSRQKFWFLLRDLGAIAFSKLVCKGLHLSILPSTLSPTDCRLYGKHFWLWNLHDCSLSRLFCLSEGYDLKVSSGLYQL